MTSLDRLCRGISRAAWGFLFLYLDININEVSITPAFLGYILIVLALADLKEEVPELGLLRTLGIILAVLEFFNWVTKSFGMEFGVSLDVIDVLSSVVSLYFNFQFLTNIATIASKYLTESSGIPAKLILYRNIQVVTVAAETVLSMIAPTKNIGILTALVIAALIVAFVVCLLIVIQLFKLRKGIRALNSNT